MVERRGGGGGGSCAYGVQVVRVERFEVKIVMGV